MADEKVGTAVPTPPSKEAVAKATGVTGFNIASPELQQQVRTFNRAKARRGAQAGLGGVHSDDMGVEIAKRFVAEGASMPPAIMQVALQAGVVRK